MTTITITPKNKELLPFLTELLSNKNWVSDFKIIEDNDKNELELATKKVNNQYGSVFKKLAE